MCFHILNLCWSNTKIFLSVLVCFWKVFFFTKMSKFSKIVLPYFGDSIAGKPSRMLPSRSSLRDFCRSLAGQYPSREKDFENFSKFAFLHISQLSVATCSRVEGPITKGTQRFSRLSSARDSLGGRSSNRKKQLEDFSRILVSQCFMT